MRSRWIVMAILVLLTPSAGWAATCLSLRGPDSWETGKTYNLGLDWCAFSNPPEVYIDWGDGANSGWFMPDWMGVDSLWGGGAPYVYSSRGVYTIRAKYRSPGNLIESDWSDPLTVSVLQSNEDIIGALEGPPQTVSGVQTIHGWVLAPRGISKVEFYINDQSIGRIPYGGSRKDIQSQYPDYPDSEYCGFVAEYNFSDAPVFSIIKVRAFDQDGLFNDIATISVTVKRFQGDVVSVTPSQRTLNFNRVTTSDGVTRRYKIVIEWSNDSQRFEIIDIEQIGR